MNIEGLKPLHIVAHSLGMIPKPTEKNIKTQKPTKFDLYQGIITVIIIISAFIYSNYGKILRYGDKIKISVIVTFSTMEMVITFTNILAIYVLNIHHGHKFLKFINKVQKLEVFIVDADKIPKATNWFLLHFIVIVLIYICSGIFSAYVYITGVGWEIYKYIAYREVQNFLTQLLIEILTLYSKLIGLRMKELNQHLHRVVVQREIDPNIKLIDEIKKRKIIKSTPKITIPNISDAYTRIAELINEFNDLFGPFGLLLCGNLILNILVPVNMALLFIHGDSVHEEHSFGNAFIILCIIWTMLPCIMGVKLFQAYDTAERETGKVPFICYSLMRTLGEHEFKLKNDLEFYASQAQRLKPKFSAAGYFDINKGLTMPIFGSVFTYIIVLMQLHNL